MKKEVYEQALARRPDETTQDWNNRVMSIVEHIQQKESRWGRRLSTATTVMTTIVIVVSAISLIIKLVKG